MRKQMWHDEEWTEKCIACSLASRSSFLTSFLPNFDDQQWPPRQITQKNTKLFFLCFGRHCCGTKKSVQMSPAPPKFLTKTDKSSKGNFVSHFNNKRKEEEEAIYFWLFIRSATKHSSAGPVHCPLDFLKMLDFHFSSVIIGPSSHQYSIFPAEF